MSNLTAQMEATVEIIKAAISTGAAPLSHLIDHDDSRKKFLDGIKELYNTIKELEK